MVVYVLFMDEFTGWLLNNEHIRNLFPSLRSVAAPLCLTLPLQAAAIFVLVLYIRLLAEAEPKDYYLSGLPKFRWIPAGILAAALYAAIVLVVLPGKWTIRIGEPAVLSVLTAVWRSAAWYLTNAHYFLVLLFGGMFFGSLRRRMSLPASFLVVGGVAAVLSFNRIDSVTDVTRMVFWGIQAAAFSLIAEYTGSVWSAVLFDFSFNILMDGYVVRLLHGYYVPNPDDVNILFVHVADNANRTINELVIGMGVGDHAHSAPMAMIYLLLMAYLYAIIRKREAERET